MPQWDYPNPRAFDHPNTCSGGERVMSTKLRSDDEPRRRRRKEGSEREAVGGDRDKDSTSSRDKQQHRSSSHKISSSGKTYRRRSTSRERERERDRDRDSERGTKKRVEVVLPEMERRTASSSASGIRSQTSYPTFSKAHSREAVHSLEDVRAKPITPAATDVNAEKRRNSTPAKSPTNPPPSPPLTADNPDIIRRSDSASSIRQAADEARVSMSEGRRSTEGTPRTAVKNAQSGASLRREAVFGQSELSSMPGAFPEDERRTTPSSGYRRTVSTASQPQSILTQNTQNTEDTGRSESTVDSGATTIPPERKAQAQRQPRIVPVFDDSPHKPEHVHEVRNAPMKKPKIIDVGAANLSTPQSFGMTPITAVPPMPPPPPPPPPVASSKEPPRVDYLLKNGGLPTMVPRRLVQTTPSIQQYSMYQSPAILQQAPIEEYSKIFSSIHERLDDYLQVLRTSGSLAVATGYKSVARRLLDKLAHVFARDISSVRCDCVICKTSPQPALSDEEDSGISWGEILEIVSGRRELPQWPPFSIKPEDGGLGISGVTQAPMQKLDIDVPEEYKDHYIRQNQKTKRAVQSWLSMQPDFPSSPPEEADEDTLMFAMMTKLDISQRNFFIALMHGQSTVHSSRAPTPAERPATASTALQRARKALQRLYRLDRAPRDCESAMYLLNNAHLHGMLATLAEVNEAEWDILVSGRFDGFLWSGAEAPLPPSASQYASPTGSRAPSRSMAGSPFSRNITPFSGLSGAGAVGGPAQPRGTTPFSPLRNAMSPSDPSPPPSHPPPMFPSRNPTPALGLATNVGSPAPVQMDEDTEIAVLAEVERNLFNDMERFEDAFEVLHSRAELVRQMLRERSAGLSLSAQLRRGSGADAAFVRLDTPASGVTDFEDEDDDGLGDTASLAPDDSASQISVNRRHKRRQGRENRTPAPVVEEDESLFEEERDVRRGGGGGGVGQGGGRRSKY